MFKLNSAAPDETAKTSCFIRIYTVRKDAFDFGLKNLFSFFQKLRGESVN